MIIDIIDGQGGGIGRELVEKLRKALGDDARIIAIGTNPVATSLMLKVGASAGASGENAVVVNAPKADIIAGSIGIISADSMLGEVTPAIARAIGASSAVKVLIPIRRCGIIVVGVDDEPLPYYIDRAVEEITELYNAKRKR